MCIRDRSYRRDAIWKFRTITSSKRCLPDFIVIGSQKSGTTSLFKYLCQHPQLIPAYNKKEVHFFDGGTDPNIDNYKKGTSWYRAHFPLRKDMTLDEQAFEASPLYIFNPLACERIASLIPEVKLIALLRNPTERAISHYFHEKKNGMEPLGIREALDAEDDRLRHSIKQKNFKSNEFIHYAYKSRGMYKEQLDRFLKLFPLNQLLVLSSEDFFCDTTFCLERIFNFLGVEQDCEVGDLTPINVGSNKFSPESDIYQYLDDYYSLHNQALYDLLGDNFGW